MEGFYDSLIRHDEIKDDGFIPKADEYDPKLTEDDYLKVLTDSSLVPKSHLDVLYYMYLMGGTASCKQISNKYGDDARRYNVKAVNIAKVIAKSKQCELYIDANGKDNYWPLLFFGKEIKGNPSEELFLYKMREPLFGAVKHMDEKGYFKSVRKSEMQEYDKNMILYGPPGTGKTYATAIYAVAICDGVPITSLKSYDTVMERFNELKEEGRIAFTTFHQSYGYEEFIEGIKPKVNSDSKDVSYEVEAGVFKQFCCDDEPIGAKVFIIDEINRGNISKIFGELITLIEDTKRAGLPEATSAVLPYSKEEFSVPSNIHILGTMNTADRSIALMDTALRRRFSFVEMMPNPDLLSGIKIQGLDVSRMLERINKRIEYLYDREHTIGHAFFMCLRDDMSVEKLASIFSKSVIPLLQEYFYEDYEKIQLVLGDNAKTNEDTKFIIDKKIEVGEVFAGGN
ncbi:MAG: AAA family ATPase, partial [Pseudobutyrivibrio sp.]|nr:AAA family ATPase [Pseudobutyrivibrio sp.]